MYHVGRPGEDGFAERFLLAWGVDGHNSHTNICSSGARLGYSLWGGYDRPSPDYANAKVILLLSSHLETGHYFNPHAQRIMEAKVDGSAKLVVLDPRMSNTASHADLWVAPWPGSEAAILLAVASHLLRTRQVDRPTCGAGSTGRPTSNGCTPTAARDFETFLDRLTDDYAGYTFEYAAEEARVPVEQVRELAEIVATAGSALSAHIWRSAAAGNLGGWQVARSLFFLNVLTGSVGTPGGTSPNGWDKFIPHGFDVPEGHDRWNELLWPQEWPLSSNEMSILLPHFLNEGRGKLVGLLLPGLQPDLDQPRRVQLDGGAHRHRQGGPARRAHPDVVGDRGLRRLRAADGPLAPSGTTPTPTRHTPAGGSASGSRCAGWRWRSWASRRPTPATPTRARCGRRTSSGSSCRGGSTPTARSASDDTSSRRTARVRRSPSTSTTAGSSRTACPGCRRRRPSKGMTPLEYMRKYGVVEVAARHLPPGRAAAHRRRGRRRGRPDATACCARRSTTSRRRRWWARPGRWAYSSTTGRRWRAGSRRAGGWSCTATRWRRSAGRSTRLPATSRRTSRTGRSTPRPARWCWCRRSGCRR